MNSKINSVFNSLFSRFITVFIVSIVFCSVLVINGNASEFFVTQSQFNNIQPYTEFQLRNTSSSYIRVANSGFVGNGTFNLHRFDNFYPGGNDGLNVANYGINAVKTMWQIPVNLKAGETFSCSFDITFDLDPFTNFLPNAISFFFGPSGDEFIGFDWASNWTENPDIYHIPRVSTVQKTISIPSNYYNWFPSSYLGSSVDANEKATVSGSFSYSGYVEEDTTSLYMVMFANPIIRNYGYWMQYTDNVIFTISNFVASDGKTAITNELLGNISNGIDDINSSLQGSTSENFNNSKIDEYQQKDTEIESMYETALNGTSSYFNDIRGLNDYAFRGVKFFGSCLTELLGITQPFYRLIIISLCLGFFATLLGIGITISSSNKAKTDKKGGRCS